MMEFHGELQKLLDERGGMGELISMNPLYAHVDGVIQQ